MVAEEAEGHRVAFETAHLDLRLDRWVALHARHADDVHQVSGELGQFGYAALYVERALVGVEPGRQVVERYFHDVLPDLVRVAGVVGQCLHIGHEHEHAVVVALIL